MALPATIQKFQIELSDVDGGRYETLELRTARHPSETEDYLVTRVIAYLLHSGEGAQMSRAGLSDPDDPPVLAHDLTGQMTHWIDLGLPSADRLHKATKRAKRVTVYCHKDAHVHLQTLARAHIHRADEVEFYTITPRFIKSVAETLTRVNIWSVVHIEGELFITIGDDNLVGSLSRHSLTSGADMD